MNDSTAHYPFRDLISKEELQALSAPQPIRVAWDITRTWLQIFTAWILAYWLESPIWNLVSMLVIGNRYYALFIVGHDGLHRRLHSDPKVNDLINDTFVLGPIGAITRVNRKNHMQHHRLLGLATDPDKFKYQSRVELSVLGLLLSFSGLPYVLRAARNVFLSSTPRAPRHHTATPTEGRYGLRDLAILFIWQTLLVLGLTLAFGWWGYFVMWLLPVAVFTVAFDLLRVFCEHSVEEETKPAGTQERMIMVTSSPIERLFFSPMNMNHHVAHHVWPSVPYFNLPIATRFIEDRCDGTQPSMILRSGYVSYLARCVRKATLRPRANNALP